jgi:hypothetical protein
MTTPHSCSSFPITGTSLPLLSTTPLDPPEDDEDLSVDDDDDDFDDFVPPPFEDALFLAARVRLLQWR